MTAFLSKANTFFQVFQWLFACFQLLRFWWNCILLLVPLYQKRDCCPVASKHSLGDCSGPNSGRGGAKPRMFDGRTCGEIRHSTCFAVSRASLWLCCKCNLSQTCLRTLMSWSPIIMIALVKLLAIFFGVWGWKLNQLVVSSSCLGKAYGSDLSEAVRKRGNTDPVGHLWPNMGCLEQQYVLMFHTKQRMTWFSVWHALLWLWTCFASFPGGWEECKQWDKVVACYIGGSFPALSWTQLEAGNRKELHLCLREACNLSGFQAFSVEGSKLFICILLGFLTGSNTQQYRHKSH